MVTRALIRHCPNVTISFFTINLFPERLQPASEEGRYDAAGVINTRDSCVRRIASYDRWPGNRNLKEPECVFCFPDWSFERKEGLRRMQERELSVSRTVAFPEYA
jgi:hypothetical protein